MTTLEGKAPVSATIARPAALPVQLAKPRSSRVFSARLRRNVGALLGLTILAMVLLVAIFADVLMPYDPLKTYPANAFDPPSPSHLFGTDEIGRDIFSRVIAGSRISFEIALLVLAVASAIGVSIGALAGYFGGWLDEICMRLADI